MTSEAKISARWPWHPARAASSQRYISWLRESVTSASSSRAKMMRERRDSVASESALSASARDAPPSPETSYFFPDSYLARFSRLDLDFGQIQRLARVVAV